ncbi:hypothetical protein BU15DRAFT_45238 [Melanogaster broomeanus]|nr:hypothetical protein BU15DRAFT_45238 [Melanogaster broomeanus]
MERTPSPSPSPPTVATAPDTIPRPRQTSAHPYRTGDLTYGRDAVLRDLQSIYTVDHSYFKKAILPPLSEAIKIESIKSSLTASKKVTPAGRWAAFDVDPKVDGNNEDTVFGRLISVFQDIVNEARISIQCDPTLEMLNKPSVAPQSPRTNSSRPDAYLRMVNKKSVSLSSDTKKDSWDDIAVSFEFKKGASEADRIDNERKIIWNMHHIMRSDPCRRATFGITIENTNTRLWFTCRSLTVVSQPFNFTEDIGNVIHVLSCFAFAKDHELGWDPTIERMLVKGIDGVKDNIQYKITIKGKVYHTTTTISDFGAEAMRGRGTRVFKAYDRSDPHKKPVVIKDAWRDSDRKREDEILKEILHDIREKVGVEEEKDARKYFLTVLNGEDVKIHERKDDTEQLLRCNALPDATTSYDLFPDKVSSQPLHTSSVGSLPLFPFRRTIPAPVSEKIHHKQHFRLVFAEAGEPIFESKNLTEVTHTLGDAVKVLGYMHMGGWVHRDVSAGNVLRYDDRGLIMDLEYAKKMETSDPSHDVRTGTADFMACEVEAQEYLFDTKATPRNIFKDLRDQVARPPFRANPLHDLESLWWILMWVLHYHVDGDMQELPPKHGAAYHRHFSGLAWVLGQSHRLGSLTSSLTIDVLPKSFHVAAGAADEMRSRLLNSYRSAEEDLGPSGPNYRDVYPESSKYFSTMLIELYDWLKNKETIRLVRPSDINKRQAEGDGELVMAGMRSAKRARS